MSLGGLTCRYAIGELVRRSDAIGASMSSSSQGSGQAEETTLNKLNSIWVGYRCGFGVLREPSQRRPTGGALHSEPAPVLVQLRNFVSLASPHLGVHGAVPGCLGRLAHAGYGGPTVQQLLVVDEAGEKERQLQGERAAVGKGKGKGMSEAYIELGRLRSSGRLLAQMAVPGGVFGRGWGSFRRRVLVGHEVCDSRVPLWSSTVVGRPLQRDSGGSDHGSTVEGDGEVKPSELHGSTSAGGGSGAVAPSWQLQLVRTQAQGVQAACGEPSVGPNSSQPSVARRDGTRKRRSSGSSTTAVQPAVLPPRTTSPVRA